MPRRRAGAVSLAGIAFLVTMLGTTLPTPLYPALEQRFGFAELGTTIVFAVYPVGVTAALLVAGHWSDLIGRRPMLLAGLAFSGLSAVLFLLPASLLWVYAARLVSGFSAGIFTGTATATIVDLADEDGGVSPRAAGLVAAAVNMGGLGLGPWVSGSLAQWAPHELVVPFVVDLVLVAVAIGCVVALPETVRRTPGARLRPQRVQVPAEVRPVFVPAAIAGFAGFAVMGMFSAVSPAFLGQLMDVHAPVVLGGVAGSVFLASILGQVLSGRMASSVALRAGCVLLVVGMVALASSLLLTSLPGLLGGGLVAGVGQGLSFRAGLTSIGEASPADQRGAISSAYFVSLYVGISVPVVGFGVLSAATGLVPAGLAFTGLVGLLAALVLALLVRRGSAARSSA